VLGGYKNWQFPEELSKYLLLKDTISGG